MTSVRSVRPSIHDVMSFLIHVHSFGFSTGFCLFDIQYLMCTCYNVFLIHVQSLG